MSHELNEEHEAIAKTWREKIKALICAKSLESTITTEETKEN